MKFLCLKYYSFEFNIFYSFEFNIFYNFNIFIVKNVNKQNKKHSEFAGHTKTGSGMALAQGLKFAVS